jgi:hypothetical protein
MALAIWLIAQFGPDVNLFTARSGRLSRVLPGRHFRSHRDRIGGFNR